MEVKLNHCGFPESELREYSESLKEFVNAREMPFLELPTGKQLEEYRRAVKELQKVSKKLIVVGIGGSSRGTRAIHETIGKRDDRLEFIDNVDPNLLEKVLRELNWEESSFLFVSKSGKTLETVVAMNVILEELHRRGLEASKRCMFISDRGTPFEELAEEFGCNFFPIPDGVGGRFSVLTAVGVIPALFAGYRVEELLEGAARVVENPAKAIEIAVAKYLNYKEGRNISVIMPYSSFMTEFTEWYVQLWAESLGKDGEGQTPVKAVGTSSQHAILQLFMDGPDDKVYQLIFVRNYQKDPVLPKEPYILPFIGGKRVSEIMEAEYRGTVFALKSKKRPMVLMEIESLSERELGELFMSYMVATVVMGKLIGVNPYGQPAVEIGKRAAERELLKGEEVRN